MYHFPCSNPVLCVPFPLLLCMLHVFCIFFVCYMFTAFSLYAMFCYAPLLIYTVVIILNVPCWNPYICIHFPCSYPFLCVPCRNPFTCSTSTIVILFYVSLFPYYYFHWMHIAHVTILLLLISVLYTAHSLMTTNACWLYSMHATCFTAFSLYATCILHFLCIQCFTMHPCWFIHLQPHVMVCTLKIFWERAHVLTRRDTLLSKDVYILCSGAVPVG